MQKGRSTDILRHCPFLTIFAKMCSLIFFLSTLYIPPLGGCRKKKKNTLRRINSTKEKSKKIAEL